MSHFFVSSLHDGTHIVFQLNGSKDRIDGIVCGLYVVYYVQNPNQRLQFQLVRYVVPCVESLFFIVFFLFLFSLTHLFVV